MRKFAFLLAVAGALVGCAGGSDEESANDESEVTNAKLYDCRVGDSFSDDMLAHLEIGLSARKLSITDVSKDAVAPDTGSLDNDFNPTPAHAGAIRFQGFPAIHEAFSSGDVAHVEFVASKELKEKKASGKLFMRTSGSGGDTTAYFCKEKSAAFKVDTARKSRLACSLDRLICQDDNPPGSTCLDDLFVNQKADGTSMRLTFMDHFGVHIVERKVDLGMTDLSRTTKKAEGKWADGTELKLEYRGGITYTGSFKLPDGRKETVKCNDLAMLD